jgi:hypothetical protein
MSQLKELDETRKLREKSCSFNVTEDCVWNKWIGNVKMTFKMSQKYSDTTDHKGISYICFQNWTNWK